MPTRAKALIPPAEPRGGREGDVATVARASRPVVAARVETVIPGGEEAKGAWQARGASSPPEGAVWPPSLLQLGAAGPEEEEEAVMRRVAQATTRGLRPSGAASRFGRQG